MVQSDARAHSPAFQLCWDEESAFYLRKYPTGDRILGGKGQVGGEGRKNILRYYMELFDAFVPLGVQIPSIPFPHLSMGSVLCVTSPAPAEQVTEISPGPRGKFPDLFKNCAQISGSGSSNRALRLPRCRAAETMYLGTR